MSNIEAPDAEVELSAQDLLALSGPCVDNKLSQAAPEKPAPATVSIEPVQKKRAAPAPTRPHMSSLQVAASMTFVVGIIGALFFVMSNDNASSSPAQVRVSQAQLPAAAPQIEAGPVLFANPFDAKEVFEFPAGTSKAEARDKVAEILMERAMQRQRQFDARVSSNR